MLTRLVVKGVGEQVLSLWKGVGPASFPGLFPFLGDIWPNKEWKSLWNESGVGYPIFEPLEGVGHDSFRLGII